MEEIRKKYSSYEIKSDKNKYIDDIFIGIINSKLIYVTKTCVTEGTYKGECSIIYNICKYPQKDKDIISFMSLYVINVENLLKNK
ncbi:hypothetical protein JJC03_02550 [Flavobacterium oreochromis]|nr:hypothetical protein [Flavobacterium oreochromis]QYS86905.1 hypothetical protein JJC03_02550 [Flavobacterium oreochromis]